MSKWNPSLVAALSLLAVGCGLQVQQPLEESATNASASAIDILSISPSIYSGAPDAALEKACGEWHLSPAQAVRFFDLATRYADPPYSEFYFVPCAINGELSADGKHWSFSIGGAGTAVWRASGTTIHWGCSAPGRAPLLLLSADGMAP